MRIEKKDITKNIKFVYNVIENCIDINNVDNYINVNTFSTKEKAYNFFNKKSKTIKSYDYYDKFEKLTDIYHYYYNSSNELEDFTTLEIRITTLNGED